MNKRLCLSIAGIFSAVSLWAVGLTYMQKMEGNDYLDEFFKRFKESQIAVFFFDVGQGDCTLIVSSDHKTTLIDSGPAPFLYGYGWDSAEHVLLPFLKSLGIDKIDHLVITHQDLDHVGGVYTLLERIKVSRLYHNGYVHRFQGYRNFTQRIEDLGIDSVILRDGDRLTLGEGIFAQVLSPHDTPSFDHNNMSLVLRIAFKSLDLLMPGDIEKEGEKELYLRYGHGLRSDVLKIPHHGSKTSSSFAFIKMVRPKAAICSSGKDNPYGHPFPSVLERYSFNGAEIFRNDRDGHVLMVSDGHQAWFVSENGRKWSVELNPDYAIDM